VLQLRYNVTKYDVLIFHYDVQQSLLALIVKRLWPEDRQQRLYPSLSKMALDMLTIPAMSAAPERLFSSANITISQRNHIYGETTESIECLKSWRKTQNIRPETEVTLD
jgi:hypothetical protein